MNSIFVFSFSLFCFLCFSVAFSKVCKEATFEKGDEVTVSEKYKNEWDYGIAYLFKKMLGRISKTNLKDLSSDNLKNLCACAIWKRNRAYSDTYTRQEYEEILDKIYGTEHGTCIITIRYCFIPYDVTVKSVLCSSGEKENMNTVDRVVITNGIQKKLGNQSSYNIYVAGVNSDGSYGDFQGVIKDLSV